MTPYSTPAALVQDRGKKHQHFLHSIRLCTHETTCPWHLALLSAWGHAQGQCTRSVKCRNWGSPSLRGKEWGGLWGREEKGRVLRRNGQEPRAEAGHPACPRSLEKHLPWARHAWKGGKGSFPVILGFVRTRDVGHCMILRPRAI